MRYYYRDRTSAGELQLCSEMEDCFSELMFEGFNEI